MDFMLFPCVLFVVYAGVLIYLVLLAMRLVRAVEWIAKSLGQRTPPT